MTQYQESELAFVERLLGGAATVMKGKLDEGTAKNNLPTQIGKSDALKLIKRFNDKPEQAYTYWLYELLVDKKINVAHFMVKAEGVKPRTMAEIAATLGGPAPSRPTAKAPPKPPELPAQAGAAEAWRDPLDHCELRTAELVYDRRYYRLDAIIQSAPRQKAPPTLTLVKSAYRFRWLGYKQENSGESNPIFYDFKITVPGRTILNASKAGMTSAMLL